MFAERMHAEFYLWLSERQSASLTAAKATPDTVDAVMQMVQTAVKQVVPVVGSGWDGTIFQARCVLVRHTLEAAADGRAKAEAAEYDMSSNLTPASTSGVDSTEGGLKADIFESVRHPTVQVPAKVDPTQRLPDRSAILAWEKENLQGFDMLPPSTSWEHALTFFQGNAMQPSQGVVVVQYALVAIEGLVFGRCKTLGQPWPEADFDVGTNTNDVQSLEKLAEVYRLYVADFLRYRTDEYFVAELRSREHLVVLALCCFIHRAAKEVHGIIKRYCMPLRATDMKHLVLFDKNAIDAAGLVATYIWANSSGPAMFSLNSGDATFTLAADFAEANVEMVKIWDAENKAAAARDTVYKATVQAKKDCISRMLRELCELKRQLSNTEFALRTHPDKHVVSYKRGPEYRSLENSVVALQAQISEKESDIEREESPPKPIWHPLPRSKHNAMKLIFFLFMPQEFRSMSRMIFMAQQRLVPASDKVDVHMSDKVRVEDVSDAVSVTPPTTLWQEYYAATSTTRLYPSTTATSVKMSSQVAVPKPITRETKVSEFCHSNDDGIWYPDSLTPTMAWSGGELQLDHRRCKHFNPFARLPEGVTDSIYTQVLPSQCSELQWALMPPMQINNSTRGNEGIASLSRKPECLSKPGYLVYSSMRAYPHLQFRNICTALHDRELPLTLYATKALLRQTLCHIGDVTESGERGVAFCWHMIDRGTPDGWSTLLYELHTLCEELAHKPREHRTLPLLAEMLSYAAQYSDHFRPVARNLAAASMQWAQDLHGELNGAKNGHPLPNRKGKLVLCLMYGILCHRAGDLTAADAADLVQLRVRVHHLCLFGETTTWDKFIRTHTLEIGDIMSSRMACIVSILEVENDRDRILTEAVRHAIASTPRNLAWQTCTTNAGQPFCFRAECPNKHVYSVNVLTGAVLFDGMPPGRLPHSITSHPLYQRTFGHRNFDVVKSSNGVLSTSQKISGFYYTFFKAESGRLVVTELKPLQGDARQRELLDATAEGIKWWGADLPERLQQMHSHWLCRETQSVALRPLSFESRAVQFVISLADAPSHFTRVDGGGAVCYVVPPEHAERPLRHKDVQQFDQLVVFQRQPSALQALGKFERTDFIHGIVRHDKTFVFHLPRFALHFAIKNTRLDSEEFKGFFLCAVQQLDDTLRGFTQYLLVENGSGGKRRRQMLVPEGTASIRSNFSVEVILAGSTECNHPQQYHVYSVHQRFSMLEAKEVLPRLHLAALYAATGTLLCEPRNSASGGETAMRLVRSSRVSRAFSEKEFQQLAILAARPFTVHSPALNLLCECLRISSSMLGFLYPHTEQTLEQASLLNKHAADCYMQLKQSGCLTWGTSLRDDEEKQIFGFLKLAPPPVPTPVLHIQDFADAQILVSAAGMMIQSTDEFFQGLLQQASPDDAQKCAPPFPFDSCTTSTVCGRETIQSLKISWEVHHGITEPSLLPPQLDQFSMATRLLLGHEARHHADATKRTFIAAIGQRQERVSTLCQKMERCLIHWLRQTPSFESPAFALLQSTTQRLRQTANFVSCPTPLDFMRMATDFCHCHHFNPFLSETARTALSSVVLLWLKLCVYEDKCWRSLVLLSTDAWEEELRRELLVTHNWDGEKYPEWLVFEVENSLQIRPKQITIAQHLLRNPGKLSQLNMGEGKTRVILPMLLLTRTKTRDAVVRVHFLSQLLHEAHDYLHCCLTASVFEKLICLVPFNRDVKLTERDADILLRFVDNCRINGGLMVVAPEHRLSLLLKRHELHTLKCIPPPTASAGDRTNTGEANDVIKSYNEHWAPHESNVMRALLDVERLPYFDLFDESDEVLKHKYQLIYATGSCQPLDAWLQRCEVAEWLLMALSCDGALVDMLKHAQISSRVERLHAGGYNELRLLAGEHLDSIWTQVLFKLADTFIANPPHTMRWLCTHPKKVLIREIMATPSISPNMVDCDLERGWQESVLAVRGLLAGGLLKHCLQLRHRVDFGVDRRATARPNDDTVRQRMSAVPFRACDKPAERSEFVHPDILILHTAASYYLDGLTTGQIKEAFHTLLALGPVAQQEIYKEWYTLSKPRMQPNQRHMLNNVRKIDLSSDTLLGVVETCYQHNMKTINFWLNNCCFPVETMQFPYRLSMNAWHLSYNSAADISGFSGTNDNKSLLPLHVEVDTPDVAELQATDGKMLHLIMSKSRVHLLLVDSGAPVWKELIRAAVDAECAAIIDAGALMAGLNNREAATEIVKQLKEQKTADCFGAVYFNADMQTWYVYDFNGTHRTLHQSPHDEKDLFVYFDESHCRGADMKLRPLAKAAVTVGPRMCKDKLMQAAGRMRQLDRRQTIVLCVAKDTCFKVQECNGLAEDSQIKPVHILKWVVDNTEHSTLKGLVEWAGNDVTILHTHEYATVAYPCSRHRHVSATACNMDTRTCMLILFLKSRVCRFDAQGVV